MWVGQNLGLVVRTNTNHPIRVRPNNNEAIVVLPSKEVQFKGPVKLDNTQLTVGSGITDTTPSFVSIIPTFIKYKSMATSRQRLN